MRNRIAAIVATYNRKALLKLCLDSLLAQSRPLDAIYVMDNASDDGTANLVKTEYKNIVYLRNNENMGCSWANHELIKKAYEDGHEWIWIADDDAFFEANALENIVKFIGLAKNISALACLKMGTDKQILINHAGFYDLRRMEQIPIPSAEYKKEIIEVDYSSYVGTLISRRAVSLVGYPNKAFFMYGCDVEYSLRLKQVGKILVVANSRVYHPTGLSQPYYRWDIRDFWKEYYHVRNLIYITKLYDKSVLFKYLILPVMLVYRFMKMTVAILLRSHGYKILRIRTILRGFYDGWLGKMGKRLDPAQYLRQIKI